MMIRTIIKLAIAALVANAVWHAGSAYLAYYRFKDAVTDAAQYSEGKSDEELRQRVLELASNYSLPLAGDGVTVRRQANHTLVDGSYIQPLDLLPGYRYQLPITFNVDTFTIVPIKPSDIINPQ